MCVPRAAKNVESMKCCIPPKKSIAKIHELIYLPKCEYKESTKWIGIIYNIIYTFESITSKCVY